MPVNQYSMVRLPTDKYHDRGVDHGAVGVVLEVYDSDAYEVEFSREDGSTIAWFSVPQDEVEPCDTRSKAHEGNK